VASRTYERVRTKKEDRGAVFLKNVLLRFVCSVIGREKLHNGCDENDRSGVGAMILERACYEDDITLTEVAHDPFCDRRPADHS
jgi:hypothetical protein